MRGERLRHHFDVHAAKWLGGIDEPFQLLQLLLAGERGRLKLIQPFLSDFHLFRRCRARCRSQQDGSERQGGDPRARYACASFHVSLLGCPVSNSPRSCAAGAWHWLSWFHSFPLSPNPSPARGEGSLE